MKGKGHVKVLVLGPGEAGKSTLVARLCTNAVNLEVNGRTVALDHGTREYQGLTFHFFGVPGQQRFAPVQEALLAGASVALVVMPSHGTLDPLSIQWCAQLSKKRVPLIGVYNHFDDSSEVASPAEHINFVKSFGYDLLGTHDLSDLLDTLYSLARKENVR